MLRADSIGWAGTRLCFYMLTSAYVLTCLLAIPCSPTLTHIDNHLTPCDTYLLASPCSPTLTHIDNHLTPCDTYLITISGRTSSTSVRHTFRFLVFVFWFSILPLVFDSVFFQIFPAFPTVTRGPGVPSQAPQGPGVPSLVIASLLPRYCLVIASLLPRYCLVIASLLPRYCLDIASLRGAFCTAK